MIALYDVKYLTGWELLERWKIQKFQLLDLIRNRRLQPYDQFGDPACRPDCLDQVRIDKQLRDQIDKLFRERDIKRKRGISKPEEIAFEIKIQEAEEQLEDHRLRQEWDAYDWSLYYPMAIDAEAEEEMNSVCDLFFADKNVFHYERQAGLNSGDQEGADNKSNIELDVKQFSPVSCEEIANKISESMGDPSLSKKPDMKRVQELYNRVYYDEAKAIRSGKHLEGMPRNTSEEVNLVKDPSSIVTNNALDKYEANIQIITKLGIEIDEIYQAIKKAVGVTDKSLDSRSQRKKAAIGYFLEHRGEFELLTQDRLADIGIYNFGNNQTNRDFVSRILKAELQAMFPGKSFSGIKAYQAYRDATRNSSTKHDKKT